MEGLLAILVGAVVVAVSPLAPVTRPVAKAAVKGGLALAGVVAGAATGAAAVATGAAAAANHQWEQLRTHVTPEKTTEQDAALTEAGDSQAAVEPGSSAGVPAETAAVAVQSAAGAAGSTDDALPAAEEADAATPSAPPSDDEVSAEDASTLTGETEGGSELLGIDGIGPKTAAILAAAGITTLAELAATDADQLRTVLGAAGARYRSTNLSTWPEQASRQLEAE